MHEQSETVEQDGKWVNVYGRNTPQAGQPLPRRYPFEQDSYDRLNRAIHAARKRSQMEGRSLERNPWRR